MIVRRGAAPPAPSDDSSSSDEDDAFSAFGGRKKKKGAKKQAAKAKDPQGADGGAAAAAAAAATTEESSTAAAADPASTETSSNKRHHHVSSARQAKMDAMLKELQEAEQSSKGHYGPGGGGDLSGRGRLPPPEKKGSYCEPGMEHLSTNLFVGNLDPCTTEEELTECFRQYGDLYSVKIMWPRTAEERARGRNTGFVCFMNRSDAQEALDALAGSDPLGTGRLLRIDWGKDVKKTVKKGVGGVPIAPIRGKERKREADDTSGDGDGIRNRDNSKRQKTDSANSASAASIADQMAGGLEQGVTSSSTSTPAPPRKSIAPTYNASIHSTDAIRVIPPSDPYRRMFITTVASFVAKDGSLLEMKLAEKESNNPKFFFLTNKSMDLSSEEEHLQERIFYRWRVYAFCQGDGIDNWRTDPFVMILPHGRFWIPPSLNKEAAAKEIAEAKHREEEIRAKQEERKKIQQNREFMTGRQLEHAKFGGGAGTASEGAAKLNDWELEKFDEIFRKKLCQSRESILVAMAFCFEKSGASKQISALLKDSLLEDGPQISPETRVARLFLLSDVLFNSQQPGVRNAYRYRDSIEAMAPEVFESLGRHGKGNAGRMTMNKLRNAVSAVLSAWADWSVFHTAFLDELQAKFDGKPKEKEPDSPSNVELAENDGKLTEAKTMSAENVTEHTIPQIPKGDWTDAQDVGGEQMTHDDVDGEPIENDDVDGEPIDADDDFDGEILADDDVDGEPL